jgi:hypothetical protein
MEKMVNWRCKKLMVHLKLISQQLHHHRRHRPLVGIALNKIVAVDQIEE